ncbi:sugar phosphate isomerase/epimerase [Candidatus Woesearchaeota archaeon]|nr:sugar phosphate isomerase/epimerase [Candidatus Woesearchaeota archaeon]
MAEPVVPKEFDFTRGYYHAMDREYWSSGLTPRELGTSAPPMENQLESLKARIFQGASKLELGFTGVGKGSMGGKATTPEMYGKDEREAIRELATLNKVELSTHATVGMQGFSGLGQGGFDESQREMALNEIRRAVEFAADTAQGGAIVFHTTEFPRPISEVAGDFTQHPFESEQAALHLVDKRTGRIVQGVRKDTVVHLPVTEPVLDRDGKPLMDEDGTPRLAPKYDEKTRQFIVEPRKYDYFKQRAEEWNKDHPDSPLKAEQMLVRDLQDARRREIKAMRERYLRLYEENAERLKRVQGALKQWKELRENIPADKRDRLKDTFDREYPGLVPQEAKYPDEFLERQEQLIMRELDQAREGAASAMQQLREFKEEQENTVPIERYAVEKSTDTIARAGMYAFDVEKSREKKGQPLQKHLFIAPENLWPENYGGHPKELKELIVGARKRMVELLTKEQIQTAAGQKAENPYYKKDITEDEAKKIAADHIKATVDIGHAYMWRKFFKATPGETLEETDKRFNKWLMGQIDELNKDKIIGHVHISDNFGYYDEHLTPGAGKVPLKEFVEKMKKAGTADFIVEPAHQDYKAMLGAWREFGASIYGKFDPMQRWSGVEHQYFGATNPPYFIFGEMSPSEEYKGAPFWSGLGLE